MTYSFLFQHFQRLRVRSADARNTGHNTVTQFIVVSEAVHIVLSWKYDAIK